MTSFFSFIFAHSILSHSYYILKDQEYDPSSYVILLNSSLSTYNFHLTCQ